MRGALASAAALLVALGGPASAGAASFGVNTAADGGDFNTADPFCDSDPGSGGEQCTLRAAFEQANQQPGLDRVDVPAGTYVLGFGELVLTDDTTVVGAGAGTTILRPQVNGRVLHVQGGTSELNGITIRAGVVANAGGGIRVGDEFARLTIRDSVVADNETHGANGGGIWNVGTLILERTTVSGNRALFSGKGGGIYNDDEADLLRLVQSTVNGNRVDDVSGPGPGLGGGIYVDGPVVDGPTELDRSTVSGNKLTGSGFGQGGGIHNDGVLTLASATVAANAGPLGSNLFRTLESQTTVRNSLFADGDGGVGCAAPASAPAIGTQGYNLDEDASCIAAPAPGDVRGVDALLGPLAANGGPTATHSLLAESPALDRGLSAAGETVDQRGLARPADILGLPAADGGNGADIGAFELQPLPMAPCAGQPATILATSKKTRGGRGDDVILGRKGKDKISGKGGEDLVCAKGGNDRLRGGAGKDTLKGGPGRDVLRGGGGRDVCKGGPGKDVLRGCERR